jgi:Zn finger protein HypA/HybF involved in hydrogenase expression
MTVVGEVASQLLEHLQSQLPPSGFHLDGIELRIGALVDIDRDLLRAALCAMLPGVDVQITVVDPLLRCSDCGVEYPHDEHPCPACGSARAELISGNELEIARAWGARLG